MWFVSNLHLCRENQSIGASQGLGAGYLFGFILKVPFCNGAGCVRINIYIYFICFMSGCACKYLVLILLKFSHFGNFVLYLFII